MRKTKGRKLPLLLIALLGTAGCARVNMDQDQPSEDQPASEQELQNLSLECVARDLSTTYKARGDRILKIIQNVHMTDAEIGLKSGADRKKAAEALKDSAEKLHKALTGIHISVKDTNDGFDVITEYDLETADLKQLEEDGLLQGGSEKSTYVSFQRTRDRLNDKACPGGLRISKEHS